jgi:hypothetical protein
VIAAIVIGWTALALAVVGVFACASIVSGRRPGE